MAAGDATAADVPGRYDVVINGKGYVVLDSVEPSLPFRTHRAIYDITPTFVERQNTSGALGDQQQDFFMTASQTTWSRGEQQKFFRSTDADSVQRYWAGANIDLRITGQVTIRPTAQVFSLGGTPNFVGACYLPRQNNVFAFATATNLETVVPFSGGGVSTTDQGAHGLGVIPNRNGLASDGLCIYLTSMDAGTVGVRKFNTGTLAYSTFSANGADSICFFGNTLYGLRRTANCDLVKWDTSGVLSSIFTWKGADGTAGPLLASSATCQGKLVAFGTKLAILHKGADADSVWTYDGTNTSMIWQLPPDFDARDMCVSNGLIYVSGNMVAEARTGIFQYDNGTISLIWKSSATTGTTKYQVPLAAHSDGIAWVDLTTTNTLGNQSQLMFYSLSTGSVATIAAFGDGVHQLGNVANAVLAAGQNFVVATDGTSRGWGYTEGSAYAFVNGALITSLFDFDSSLPKVFRTAQVDWTQTNNGDTVDIYYQVDSLTGAWTLLKSGATSGTEYSFPGGTSGHAVALKLVLTTGAASGANAGPIVRRTYLRAAPQLRQFKSSTYIIDCTGNDLFPRELRDGSGHPLSGKEQVTNLLAAAQSTVPFSVTDKVNGTFTALVDLQDPEGWDVYEVHPDTHDPARAGSYAVRIKVREV